MGKHEETPGDKSGNIPPVTVSDQPLSYNSQNKRPQKKPDDQLSSEYAQSTESTDPSRFATPNKLAILSEVQIEDLSTQENQRDMESFITSNLEKATLNRNSDNSKRGENSLIFVKGN